jgi:cephalosporin hydroxylase
MGWAVKYPYSFSWMGLPIIQLPEDMVRAQETIHRVRPNVIIETGVARGGSLVYYASLLKMLGIDGRIVGVDIEIRPHNRAAIEAHALAPMITLIEGSSTAPEIVAQAMSHIKPGDKVLIFLDSNHTFEHVANELEAYHRAVTPGSYIVATDGAMEWLSDVPRGRPEWTHDNPKNAAIQFAAKHPEFTIDDPLPFVYNEGELTEQLTHWPSAWLRRK